jgi:uncharacterized protein (DUF1330 family)
MLKRANEIKSRLGRDEPFVMLNLLKFKPDGGKEMYAQYGEKVLPLLVKAGGNVLCAGFPVGLLIGDVTLDDWDECIIVRYPSWTAFWQMSSSPEWAAIGHLRNDALLRSVAAPMKLGHVRPAKL